MMSRAALLSSLMLLLLLLGSSCQARPVRHSEETEEVFEDPEEVVEGEPEEEEEELLLPEEEEEGSVEDEDDDGEGSSTHGGSVEDEDDDGEGSSAHGGSSEHSLERLIFGADERSLPPEFQRNYRRTSRTSRMRVNGDESSLPPQYRRSHTTRSHQIVGNTEASLPPDRESYMRLKNLKRKVIDGGIDKPLPYRHGYIGCYKDKRSSRDLPKLAYTSAKNSVMKCRRECQRLGYHYAGLQAGKQCRCGKHFGKHGQARNCNAKCTGNSRQTCGGNLANSIYHSLGFRDVGIHSRIGGKGPLPAWFSIGKPSTPPGSTDSSLPPQFRKKTPKIGKHHRNIRGGTESSIAPKYRKIYRRRMKHRGFRVGGTDSSLAPKYRKKNRKITKHHKIILGGTDSSLPPQYRKKNRKITKHHKIILGGTDSSLPPKYRKKHTTHKIVTRHVRIGGEEVSLPPQSRKHHKVTKTTTHRIVKTHGKVSKGHGGPEH